MERLAPKPSKIFAWEELFALREQWRQQGLRVVFTNGVFDILHGGHVDYLWAARAQGDKLILGLNTDASVKRFKDPRRPLNSQSDRAAVLCSLRMVDALVYFDHDTPLELIKGVKPDILVKGADYREEEIVGAKEVRAYGGRVVRVPLTEGKSTTSLINRILEKFSKL